MTTAHHHDLPALAWPAPEVVVLRNRPLRAGSDTTPPSRFSDEIWRLTPAHPDAHNVVNGIRWNQFPPLLVPQFKAFVLAALDHPFPLELAVGRADELPSVATIWHWSIGLRVFAEWLTERGIKQLNEITDTDLEAYRVHVLSLNRTPARKMPLFNAVRALWAYRVHLPEDCRLASLNPWGGASGLQLANAPGPGRVNKTPRIAPATMEALLAWALRVVENIGPDIRDAWIEYRQLDDGTHPTHRHYNGLGLPGRIDMFLTHAKREGRTIPGHLVDGQWEINWQHLGRVLGRWSSWPTVHKQRVRAARLPIAEGSYVGDITGRVHGLPWRDRPITTQELPGLIRVLSAACFITICYLSGARPGEVLNLERACTDVDETTAELLIQGHVGKGRNRSAAPESVAAHARPWVVVQPVHAAVQMMESLAGYRYLFPSSIGVFNNQRPNDEHARKTSQINGDIAKFITWVNTSFQLPGGSPAIPPDPARHVHARRFRRTLAYFIVRRPRGLIAAALQYAHVSTKVTLSYSGNADTSWMDDLAIERLEAVVEQIDDDLSLLEDGEHVSGPSSAEYRARIMRVSRFAGRAVTGVRNAERLLTQADPSIHHGEAMTCVWRAETAACRKAKLEQELPIDDEPDESECRTSCQNLAYTDRDIEQIRKDVAALSTAAQDPLAPRPIRDRAAARADQRRVIIEHHESSRPAATGADEGESR